MIFFSPKRLHWKMISIYVRMISVSFVVFGAFVIMVLIPAFSRKCEFFDVDGEFFLESYRIDTLNGSRVFKCSWTPSACVSGQSFVADSIKYFNMSVFDEIRFQANLVTLSILSGSLGDDVFMGEYSWKMAWGIHNQLPKNFELSNWRTGILQNRINSIKNIENQSPIKTEYSVDLGGCNF